MFRSLQKLTYAGVLFVLFPLMIVTGLLMSPGMDAFAPWLITLIGRQTAHNPLFRDGRLGAIFHRAHRHGIRRGADE